MYRNLWQFSIHQNDPTLRCTPAKRDHVKQPLKRATIVFQRRTNFTVNPVRLSKSISCAQFTILHAQYL